MSQLSGDQKADAQLIGQFGVGFYSGFIVADKITVESRRAGLPPEEGVRWVSGGAGDFEVETITRPQRGTSVTLHLRDDAAEYLSTLEAQVHHRQVLRPHLPAHPDARRKSGRKARTTRAARWSRPASGRPSTRPARCGAGPRRTSRDEQYQEFYKSISHDYEAPLAWSHNRVEGSTEYTQLLYIPSQGAVRPVEPREGRGRQALRQARLHHGRRRGAAADLPALRQGRDRLGRPAAQREPRAAAGKPRREGDPRRQHQARAGMLEDLAKKQETASSGERQDRHRLRRIGARAQPAEA